MRMELGSSLFSGDGCSSCSIFWFFALKAMSARLSASRAADVETLTLPESVVDIMVGTNPEPVMSSGFLMKSGSKLSTDFGVGSISGGFMVGRNIVGLLTGGEELDGGENVVEDLGVFWAD